jgi:hypothetical protein
MVAQMNVMELAIESGLESGLIYYGMGKDRARFIHNLQAFAALIAAHEREAIMKSIEELRPVENNPLLQNKPAAFWVENFRQIVYARSNT